MARGLVSGLVSGIVERPPRRSPRRRRDRVAPSLFMAFLVGDNSAALRGSMALDWKTLGSKAHSGQYWGQEVLLDD